MRKNNFFIAVVLMAITTINCRKQSVNNTSNKNYTISGRLLESTSNPIPIANFAFSVNQKTDYGIIGTQTGFSLQSKTDNDGNFTINYKAEKGLVLASLTYNSNPISISTDSILPISNTYFGLNYITALKDTNVGNQYILKNIQTLVHKIRLNNALTNTDTLFFSTKNLNTNITKTIFGPKPSGSLIIVDTITQFKTSDYDFYNKSYSTYAFIKKNSSNNFYKNYSLNLSVGDESFKEWILDWNF